MTSEIRGSWDGAVEPFQPGGIGTYGCVAYRGSDRIFTDHGLSAVPFGEDATNNVAEYVGLVRLLEWLARNGHVDAPVRLIGDSKLVISQVLDKWRVNTERLRPLHRLAREFIALFPDIQIAWVPREQNKEADGLTHLAYVEYLERNPHALAKLPLATESQLQTLRDHGIDTYRHMGAREASRLLERRLRAIAAAQDEH